MPVSPCIPLKPGKRAEEHMLVKTSRLALLLLFRNVLSLPLYNEIFSALAEKGWWEVDETYSRVSHLRHPSLLWEICSSLFVEFHCIVYSKLNYVHFLCRYWENEKVRLDYRPVHLNTLDDEIESFPPKARVYWDVCSVYNRADNLFYKHVVNSLRRKKAVNCCSCSFLANNCCINLC